VQGRPLWSPRAIRQLTDCPNGARGAPGLKALPDAQEELKVS